jgi:hypothetical protein
MPASEIFGRKESLFELQKAWAVALSGRPRVVFVEGAGGLGKTHLAEAFLDGIRDQKTIDKRPLVGRGRCTGPTIAAHPLRPLWDAVAEILEATDRGPTVDDLTWLDALGRLSASVPVDHLPTVGPALARLWRATSDADERRSPPTPSALIRRVLLELTTEHPVALFVDEVELADAATIELLIDLLEDVGAGQEPCHLLLLIGVEPTQAARLRTYERLQEEIERHDQPNNRVLHRLGLEGLGRTATGRLFEHLGETIADDALCEWLVDYGSGRPRLMRDLLRGLAQEGLIVDDEAGWRVVGELEKQDEDWRLPSRWERFLERTGQSRSMQGANALLSLLDGYTRQLVVAAALQGRRFSATLAASACGRDELDATNTFNDLEALGLVERVGAPLPFEPRGQNAYAFACERYVEAAVAGAGADQRRALHGRIANQLLLIRGRLRDDVRRLGGVEAAQQTGALAERFAADHAHAERALRSIQGRLAEHLARAARPVEAALYLAAAFENCETGPPREGIRSAYRARHTLWFARLAEDILLATSAMQAGTAPRETARAIAQAARVAADCRARMGCYGAALALLDHAHNNARWLGDEQQELGCLEAKLAVLYASGRRRQARQLCEELGERSELGSPPEGLRQTLKAHGSGEDLRAVKEAAQALDPFDPVELATIAATCAIEPAESVRALVGAARQARADGKLRWVLTHLKEARERLGGRPEFLPAARLICEELALASEAKASNQAEPGELFEEGLGWLERSVEHAQQLGQLDVCFETAARAIGLARRCRSRHFWRHQTNLLATATDMGSLEHLSRAFDICFELLEQAQREPVFGEAEEPRLQDALEEFVGHNTPYLQQIGASGLLSKWDSMLAKVIEATTQMS